jgi:hypothetical protein
LLQKVTQYNLYWVEFKDSLFASLVRYVSIKGILAHNMYPPYSTHTLISALSESVKRALLNILVLAVGGLSAFGYH